MRAERNYEVGQWAAYDRQFRREALDLNWFTPDPRLYSARSIPCCGKMTTYPNSAHRTQTSLGWLGCQAQRPGRVPRLPQPANPPTSPMSCATGSLPTGIYTHASGAVVALTQQSLAARVSPVPSSPSLSPGQGMWAPARC